MNGMAELTNGLLWKGLWLYDWNGYSFKLNDYIEVYG